MKTSRALITRPALIATGAALGFAVIFCELKLRACEADVISSHQARMDCVNGESQKLCRSSPSVGFEDFEYCQEAVQVCKKNGAYQSMQNADAAYESWGRITRIARVMALILTGSLILGAAIKLMRRQQQQGT